jgi:hypothetical protein
MTTIYKLTTQDYKTRKGFDNETQWGSNVTHSATGKGDLCGPGWIHGYTDPLLAVLLNSVHANISDPICWECDASGDMRNDHGLKVGYVTVTTLRIVDLPAVTPEQKIKFGILCALKVYRAPAFVEWAENWLSGKDRSVGMARLAAAETARARAEGREAAIAAVDAARARAEAQVAAEAARAAEMAEAAARAISTDLDLISIARQAIA